MFVDEVRIHIKAGRGGDGACSFRREKFVPRGGPDGGDGGHGGNVVFEASPRMTTLLDLRYQKHYEAEAGRQGGAANCSGRTGADVVVALPVGTV
ncbi:MAG: GTPase ObgE, partial [Nitrospiraceae bacterium]